MKTFLPLLAALAFVGCAAEEPAPEAEPIPVEEPAVDPMVAEPIDPMTDSTMSEMGTMEDDMMADSTEATM